jgi:hypothetical protein
MRSSFARHARKALTHLLHARAQGDPFSVAGSLWSFNFFLYNRKLRRILFFTAAAIGKHGGGNDEDGMGGDEDEDGNGGFFHMEDDEMDL